MRAALSTLKMDLSRENNPISIRNAGMSGVMKAVQAMLTGAGITTG